MSILILERGYPVAHGPECHITVELINRFHPFLVEFAKLPERVSHIDREFLPLLLVLALFLFRKGKELFLFQGSPLLERNRQQPLGAGLDDKILLSGTCIDLGKELGLLIFERLERRIPTVYVI